MLKLENSRVENEKDIKSSDNETILTETETAKFLKISKMTVIRLRKSGKLKFFRIGFRIVYSLERHIQPFLIICQKVAENEVNVKGFPCPPESEKFG